MQFKFLTLAVIACFVLCASAAPVGSTSPSDDSGSAGGGVDPNSDLNELLSDSMNALSGATGSSDSFGLQGPNTDMGAGVGTDFGGVGTETNANTDASVSAGTDAGVGAETGAGVDVGKDIVTNGGASGGANGEFAAGAGANHGAAAGDGATVELGANADAYNSMGSSDFDAAGNAGP
ncbi:uncharacterized protein B0P05DRAFT_542024 [Gilbertella persicaria]|uniref:uncharacterized protein n=1 Tax=Gilbertella persicaria TaxID=101096 RepID=UPI0022212917|nr:uncharacterized protein B0P05DRAFT_542024 [Gilbertella persicaria]KAI8079006.1 hypothetical protein B0P05DRAFT_542024 [Gilbertella persicaria]